MNIMFEGNMAADRMYLRLRVATAAVLSAFAVSASAGDEDFYFSELPIVASVSRLPQRFSDTPAAVTVLDRDLIRASGARDFTDLLRLVPGFQMHMNNTDSARASYHGLTDETYSPRMQVLVDGRSLHSPLFRNGTNWATLPVALADIERVEVVRGSNAVSYGTNAFLGVVNIITVDPVLVRGSSVEVVHGERGVRDQTFRHGGKLGESGDFRLTYQSRRDDGLADRGDWVDTFASRLFDFRADFALGIADTFQLSIGHVEADMPRGRLGNASWPIHNFAQASTHLQGVWRHVQSPDSDFRLRYSYVSDWASDRYMPAPSFFYDEYGDRGTRHEIEFQKNQLLREGLRSVWGVSWRHDQMQSETLLANRSGQGRDVARVFANFEWKPAHWFTGNAGLSVENDSLGGRHVSPRVSGNFHLDRENTLRLAYARAYRTGSIVDYRGDWWSSPSKYQFRGDPGMPAEKLDSLELGYLGDWREWRASLDLRLFHERIGGRLFQYDRNGGDANVPDVMGPVQNVDVRGVEYQFRWQPWDGTRLLMNQAFIHISSEYISSPFYGNSSLMDSEYAQNLHLLAERSAPRYTNSLMWMQALPGNGNFSVAGHWLDRMKWTRNSAVDKYHRVDLRLAYPFSVAGHRGEVSYTVRSFNGRHGEYRNNVPENARVVEPQSWLGVRLDF